MARPYGLQNPYLPAARVQCSGSHIEHFVGCWSEGSAGLMAPLVHPFPWLRPCIHTTAEREHLDYCDGSLTDIVCNLCMVDKSNLTNRSLVTDGD